MELTLLSASAATGASVALRCEPGSKLVRLSSSARATVQVEFSSDGSTWSAAGILRPTGSAESFNYDNPSTWVRLNVLNNAGTVTASIAGIEPQRQLAVDSITTGVVIGDGTAAEASRLVARTGVGFPVPVLIAEPNDSAIAFDVVHRGSPTDLDSGADRRGAAWTDIGGPIDGSNSSDINTLLTNSEWVRIGKYRSAQSSMAHLSTQKYGTGTVRDLGLQLNGGNVIVASVTSDATSAKLQVIGNFSSQVRYRMSRTNTATATGNSQGTAYVLTTDITIFTTVAASTGALLPAPGSYEMWIFNHGANALAVYPQSGGTLGTLSANTAVSVPAGKSIQCYGITTAWGYLLSA